MFPIRESLPADIPAMENEYRSALRPIGILPRHFPSLCFYPHMISVVWRAAGLSKRGRYGHAEWIQSSVEIVEALEASGVRLHLENLSAFHDLEGPCVFIGNHMSTLETFVLPCIIRPHRPVTFVVKEGLARYPVFRHIMRSIDPIVVGRQNPREDLKAVLDGGEERLAKGISIIVFPQSTRSVHLDPEQFNSIGVKLARRARVPIVPLALKTDAWGNGRLIKDFGPIDPARTVRFSFGQALHVSGNGRQEHSEVTAFIQSRLAAWEQENGEARTKGQ